MKLIVANWQSATSIKQTLELVGWYQDHFNRTDLKLIVCPSLLSLFIVSQKLTKSSISLATEVLGPQTDSWSQLKNISNHLIINCHFLGVNLAGRLLVVALKYQFEPIVIIGDNLHQRLNHQTPSVIDDQINRLFYHLTLTEAQSVTLVYQPLYQSRQHQLDPVWIGQTLDLIRDHLTALYQQPLMINILYRGSIDHINLTSLLGLDLAGLFVDRASLNRFEFDLIVQMADRFDRTIKPQPS